MAEPINFDAVVNPHKTREHAAVDLLSVSVIIVIVGRALRGECKFRSYFLPLPFFFFLIRVRMMPSGSFSSLGTSTSASTAAGLS